ncbi:MAG TPA: hypothetical protein VG537_01600 [Candidatus Kapabacteria bacterium]|nr:hypothetical protein [Candidatus Kapabacteria bacterium]
MIVLLLSICIPTIVKAQGGIGNMPRSDIVMLRQSVRDSLADEVYAKILDLKHYGETGQTDSASQIIAYNGQPNKAEKWARPVNIQDSAEKARVITILNKVNKLFNDYPDVHREYYAVFKTKDAPSGQMYLYQIHHVNGNKQRMVSWVFYPIGDKLLFGDFN